MISFNSANLLNVSWPYLSIFNFLSFQIGFSYRRVWALEQAGSLTQQQCGILVPRLGIESASPVLEAWSLNHWPTREVPNSSIYFTFIFPESNTSRKIREKKKGKSILKLNFLKVCKDSVLEALTD